MKVCSTGRECSKNLCKRLVDYNIYALDDAFDEATLKEESHAYQYLAGDPKNATSTPMLMMTGSELGLGIDVHGIDLVSLAARESG